MDYKTGFFLARAKDKSFDSWFLKGCSVLEGYPVLDTEKAVLIPKPSDLPERTIQPDFKDSPYFEGFLESPELVASFGFSSCIPSWNAVNPEGSWLEPELCFKIDGSWSPWIKMAYWAMDDGVLKRSSIKRYASNGLSVDTDTVKLDKPAAAFKFRFRLCMLQKKAAESQGNFIRIKAVFLSYSDPKPVCAQSTVSMPEERPEKSAKAVILDTVPCCSQMVYPDGGDVWCSPTSVSMVLGYWQKDKGPCEPRVKAAVSGVYDRVYGGHGNWSFNVAYAGSQAGMEAYAARFGSLSALEPWIKSGVPLVLSVSWNNEEGKTLSGAPVPKSAGHLTTLVGFDKCGDPVMNEPASPTNETVRRTYRRSELETRWLLASGGLAYLIFPSGSDDEDRARLF